MKRATGDIHAACRSTRAVSVIRRHDRGQPRDRGVGPAGQIDVDQRRHRQVGIAAVRCRATVSAIRPAARAATGLRVAHHRRRPQRRQHVACAAASCRAGSASTICTVSRPASWLSSEAPARAMPSPSAAASTVRNSMIAMIHTIARVRRLSSSRRRSAAVANSAHSTGRAFGLGREAQRTGRVEQLAAVDPHHRRVADPPEQVEVVGRDHHRRARAG